MRLGYFDESGTGRIDKEPFTVVAGVLIRADAQWLQIEQHLRQLADSFAVPEDREGFVFHAVELMNGGKLISREKYTREKRREALHRLCEIPQEFDLPVFMAVMDRTRQRDRAPTISLDEHTTTALVQASLGCIHGVERYMREHGEPGEVAALVFEQNGPKSKQVRASHNLFRSLALSRAVQQHPHFEPFFLSRVVETAHFAEKTDSSILQIADACAYVLARRMRGVAMEDDLWAPLVHMLVCGPSSMMAAACRG